MKIHRIIIAILLLPLSLMAQDLLSIYSEAMQDARSADLEKVQEGYQTLRDLAEKHPADQIADDALYQAGEVAERYLGQYDTAREIYRLVIERYPKSKYAARAAKGLERLAQAAEIGDQPYKIFAQIKQEYLRLGSEEALRRMKELAQNYPDFKLMHEVNYWIAQEYSRRRQYQPAIEYYEKLLARPGDERMILRALLGIGQTYIEMRKFTRAVETYKKIPKLAHDPDAAKISHYNVQVARNFLLLWGVFWAMLIVLWLWIAGLAYFPQWERFRFNMLWRAWPEIVALAVPFSVALFYAWNKSLVVRRGLLFLLAGSLIVAVANALYIQLQPAGKIKVARFMPWSFVVAVAAIYVTLYLSDLINILRDMLKMSFQL